MASPSKPPAMLGPLALSEQIELPASGRVLTNRLVKSSMTECLADPRSALPNERHCRLFQRWANGGCSMILTGNVMIDRNCREAPRNVALDEKNEADLKPFKKWSDSVRRVEGTGKPSKNTKPLAVMQLSHPGRQAPLATTGFSTRPLAPSGGAKRRVRLPGLLGWITSKLLVRTPVELHATEIKGIVGKFAASARLAEKAGFDGIQIHAAHGYLVSQFLSVSGNFRTDEYGGDKERRRRFLMEIIDAVKACTSDTFILGVKINVKDTSKDGLEREKECLDLVLKICEKRIDFIELSGGDFEESLHVQNVDSDRGNGYDFVLPFAEQLKGVMKKVAYPPLVMLTGGFRKLSGMELVVQNGYTDLIGLARPLCLDPDIAQDMLSGSKDTAPSHSLTFIFGNALLGPVLNSLWHTRQIKLLSEGKSADLNLSLVYILIICFAKNYIWDPAW